MDDGFLQRYQDAFNGLSAEEHETVAQHMEQGGLPAFMELQEGVRVMHTQTIAVKKGQKVARAGGSGKSSSSDEGDDDDDDEVNGTNMVLQNSNSVEKEVNGYSKEEKMKKRIHSEQMAKKKAVQAEIDKKEQNMKQQEKEFEALMKKKEADRLEEVKKADEKDKEEKKKKNDQEEKVKKEVVRRAEQQKKRADERLQKKEQYIKNEASKKKDQEQAAKKKLQEQRNKDRYYKQKWENLDPQAGFRNYHHTYTQAHVRSDGNLVFLGGVVTRPRWGSGLIATLPPNYRPGEGRLVFTICKGKEARVDVLPDGRVYYITGGSAWWTSLNGISFNKNRQYGLRLFNGWIPYTYGYRRVTTSTERGLCMISGLIRNGRWSHMARVHRGCWPDRRLIFNGDNHSRVSRLDVLPNGYIVYTGGYRNHGWVSFDGMAWTTRGNTNLRLYNGWSPYGGSYRHPSYKRVGKICVVSGLIRSASWKHFITTLPSNCRPHRRLIFQTNIHHRAARIDVLPDGRMYWINHKTYTWLSLDGVKFLTADS